MCGITGAIWTKPELAIQSAVLSRMTNVLHHRGPDADGAMVSDYHQRSPYESMPGVALGHRRLSIIDIDGGKQPMPNEDRSVWVVFNGEIYNFPALRNRLEGAGHRFRTQSDTETIVHLYEEHGPDCFQHLVGMFAIAIWDANHRRLVLARDRLGQKPLVYKMESGRLLFASELKSLLQVPGLDRQIDPNAVDEYLLYQYVPHPNTIFRGMNKLPPGHLAIYQDGKLDVRPYWMPDVGLQTEGTAEEYVGRLRQVLRTSVAMRMQSDVPLGAFLSGGVDSSIIVALMQELHDEPVKTFSIGFPVPEYDESEHARRVAQHLGTDHHEFQIHPNHVKILPKLVWQFDEPFADSSTIPTWYLSQWTRGHVTVALTGDGGDELFAGYPRYRAVQLGSWFDAIPGPIRGVISSPLWQRMPASPRQKSWRRRFKRLVGGLGLPPVRRYLEWIGIFNDAQRAELYTDEFLDRLADSDPASFLASAWNRATGRDPVTTASLADLVTYLPCDLMTKVDMSSMAHSLECRQPFLDHRVVDLAVGMPLKWKVRFGRGKRLLWRAFGDLLPADIGRRPKMGFGVPLDRWFRGELNEMTRDVLTDPSARSRGIFRPQAVERYLSQHTSGVFDHSHRLWALLVFEMWMREWM